MTTEYSNSSLNRASKVKNDEFYTQLPDIEKELKHYKSQFRGKVVYCNCDDPSESNFIKYFVGNFNALGLKRLIATSYRPPPTANSQLRLSSDDKTLAVSKGRPKINANKLIINEVADIDDAVFDLRDIVEKLKENKNNEWLPIEGGGDFRSHECTALLEQADIVVTNPPFSLFREYVEQLVKQKKKFLVIGNQNAVTYKEIFGLIKANNIWLGYTHPVAFVVPDHYEMREVRSWRSEDGTNWRSLGNACWFTNLDIQKRHEELITVKEYGPKEYPSYDNYNAIEVSRYKDIPSDYDGVMGVPVTFLGYYNPEQFEIVGSDYDVKQGLLPELLRGDWTGKHDRGYVMGRRLFARVFIRKRAN